MEENLGYKTRNIWANIDREIEEKISSFSQGYKEFLGKGKTERLATKEIVARAREKGFEDLDDLLKEGRKLLKGDRVFKVNKNKSVGLFVIGQEDILEGMNIIASHIDSPRLDLKQVPLYEKEGLAYFKTHYYGGIKKYQWLALPLELHGIVIDSEGKEIEISIGDGPEDPVMYITDLLPHLDRKQMDKKASEFIPGESLNILVGSRPLGDGKEGEGVRENILKILREKYGIVEEDFISAELEIVPQGRPRDLGLDRSMIVGYGQDDRACAYSSLEAILNLDRPRRTALGLFMDKEEIGSTGNTGMTSRFLENSLMDLMYLLEGEADSYRLYKALERSYCLSADVAAAYDPDFPEVYEINNSSKLNHGVTLVKYTGARGKSGSSDANAEFLAYIRRLFNKNSIFWQTGELGKVDEGGGGTIAYMLAEYGMEVIDCGVGVLSMHSPYEVISKADLYMTYRAYRVFFQGDL